MKQLLLGHQHSGCLRASHKFMHREENGVLVDQVLVSTACKERESIKPSAVSYSSSAIYHYHNQISQLSLQCDSPFSQRVHVHLDVWSGSGIVPEGESSVLVQESGEAERVCEDTSDVGGCVQRPNQLPPTARIVLHAEKTVIPTKQTIN